MRSLRPHARAPRRIGATRGDRAELHRVATSRHFLADVAIQRVRNLGNVAVELRHAGEHRQGAVRGHPGISVAGLRHGYFFINTDKGIKAPADLKGKRGGVPEYTMTAAVYMRGLLQ